VGFWLLFKNLDVMSDIPPSLASWHLPVCLRGQCMGSIGGSVSPPTTYNSECEE
jgi:hypothetical protein